MLWKSKLLAGLVWIALGLLSAAIIYSLPATYKAEAVILVDGQKVPERYVASTANADIQDRLAAISQRILASSRLETIINTYHLYDREKTHLPLEEIIDLMRKDTKITLEHGGSQEHTSSFRISYEGRDPVVVAEVANQIGNLFIEENLRTREKHAEGTAAFIEEQLQQAKKTLHALELQVADYKLQHKGELPEQQDSLASAMARLQMGLQANQDAINRGEESKALLQNSLNAAESAAKVLERTAARNAAVGASSGGDEHKTAAALQAELDALRLRYTEAHPDVQRLEQLLAQARRSEKAAAAPVSHALDPPAPDLLQQRERIASLETEAKLAAREIEFRRAERKDILAKLAALQAHIDALPVREQELTALSRDYETARANYQSLLDKRIAADMASDLEHRQEGERFTMIDPAQPSAKPFSPDRPQLLWLALTASLFAAVVAGLAREFKRNVLLGEWELPPDIPILGRVSPIAIPARARGPVLP